jgi:hypothetical protein
MEELSEYAYSLLLRFMLDRGTARDMDIFHNQHVSFFFPGSNKTCSLHGKVCGSLEGGL